MNCREYCPRQSDHKIEKNCPTFWNVAKIVAKISRLKLKVQNIGIKLLSKVKISTTNLVTVILTFSSFAIGKSKILKF